MTADAAVATTQPELVGHEVIICTRNRPKDLANALASLASSSRRLAVLIVDSSNGDGSLEVFEGARVDLLSGWRLRYIKSEPGLPLQRNVGLDNSASTVVHFIDDDVEVFPDYFERIAQDYSQHSDSIVGVGGVQHHIPPRQSSRIRRFAQIEAKPGRLSASAVSNLVTEAHGQPMEVDWLSGCCMSFRTEIARSVRFNEDLLGYALGEDVEFSLRIAQHGKLFVDTSARVDHHLSETNRSNVQVNVRDTLRHRWRLIKQHPDDFSVVAFWFSVLIDAARYLVGGLLGRATSRQALAGVVAAVRDLSGRG